MKNKDSTMYNTNLRSIVMVDLEISDINGYINRFEFALLWVTWYGYRFNTAVYVYGEELKKIYGLRAK